MGDSAEVRPQVGLSGDFLEEDFTDEQEEQEVEGEDEEEDFEDDEAHAEFFEGGDIEGEDQKCVICESPPDLNKFYRIEVRFQGQFSIMNIASIQCDFVNPDSADSPCDRIFCDP